MAETSTEVRPDARLADSLGIEPAAYTADDIGRKLQISTRHVWRMNDDGTLPRPFRIGRLVRWPAAIIDRWISEGCPPCRKSR